MEKLLIDKTTDNTQKISSEESVKSTDSSTNNNQSSSSEAMPLEEMAMYAGALILLVALCIIEVLRLNKANKNASEMILSRGGGFAGASESFQGLRSPRSFVRHRLPE